MKTYEKAASVKEVKARSLHEPMGSQVGAYPAVVAWNN